MSYQGTITALEAHPFGERLLVALRALVFYLIKMLWPTNLAPLYPYPSKVSFFMLEYIGAFALVFIITAFCIYSWRKQKIWSAVWAYYLVTLLPVLGIIQPGDQAAADRYTYLPSLGPFLLVGLSVRWTWWKIEMKEQNLIKGRLSLIIPSILIVSLLSVLTTKQNMIWKDSFTLWNTEARLFPDNFQAYVGLCSAYLRSGNYQNAINECNEAIKLNPGYSKSYYNRGLAYKKSGDYSLALNDFNMAIHLNPHEVDAYTMRGNVYFILGNYQEAIQDYNRAIMLNPQSSLPFHNRAIVYRKLGIFLHAIDDLNKSIEIDPHDPELYKSRAETYLLLGNHQQAIKDFQVAAKLGDKKAQDFLMSKGIGW